MTALLEDTHHHPLSSTLPWLTSVTDLIPLPIPCCSSWFTIFSSEFQLLFHGTTTGFSFLQAWLASINYFRKEATDNLLMTSTSLSSLCSVWCSLPHAPGNIPYLAPHVTLSLAFSVPALWKPPLLSLILSSASLRSSSSRLSWCPHSHFILSEQPHCAPQIIYLMAVSTLHVWALN